MFVILMENKGYDRALGGDYTASLVSQYAVASDYHAVVHLSLPNYLALTSGSTWGITDEPGSIRSKRTSGAPLVSRARKRSSNSWVFWRQHVHRHTAPVHPHPVAGLNDPRALVPDAARVGVEGGGVLGVAREVDGGDVERVQHVR